MSEVGPPHPSDRVNSLAGMTTSATATGPPASHADFRLFADGLAQIVWMSAPDGHVECFNRCGASYTGYPVEVIERCDLVSLVHPDDAGGVSRAWEQAALSGTSLGLDCRIRRADGEVRWHAVCASPIRDELGAVVRWIGTATDIDADALVEVEPPSADSATTDTLALLETLVADAPVGFGFVDRNFRQVLINETMAAIHGSTVADQLGQTVAVLVPELWPQLEPLYRQVIDRGESILDVKIEGMTAADPTRLHHWLASYYPVSISGEVIGVGIVTVDVTDRDGTEQENRQLAAIVEDSGVAIFGAGLDGIATSWNRAAERLFGYVAEDIIGRAVLVLVPDGLRSEHLAMRARIAAGGSTERYETRRLRKDGSLIDVICDRVAGDR